MARSTWGSIRKKTKDSWEIRYNVAGVPKSEMIRGSRSDAERRKAELRVKYEGASEGITLSQFWNIKYHDEIVESLAKTTVSGYENLWINDVEPRFGDTLLSDIRPREIQEWLSEMTNGKAKHAKALLSSILGRAFALEYVDDNAAQRRYKMPSAQSKKARTDDVYEYEEILEIAKACKGEVFEGAFLMAAFGGGSRSEVMGVKPDEIFNIDGFAAIPVKRTVHRVKGKIEVEDHGKNKTRESWIIVPPPMSTRIFEIADDLIAAGEEWFTPDGFGFVMCPNNMATAYKRWFVGNPFRYVPFSNLRNSYATFMGGKMDRLSVSKMMRHSVPSTTYINYDRATAKELIETLKSSKIWEEMGNES